MKQINMLESPVRQVFFSYLVPSISATLVTSIYILADTMMIGRGVGGSGIAAMNILLPLYNTYFGIGMMCGVGGGVAYRNGDDIDDGILGISHERDIDLRVCMHRIVHL